MTTKRKQPEKALKLYRDDKAYMQMLLDALSLDESEESEINQGVIKAVLDKYDEVLDCAENDKPFIASWFAYAAEIFTAMGVPWWMFPQTAFLGIEAPHVQDDVDGAERLLGSDFCTILRLSLYYVEADMSPKPSACIALLHPCDGTVVVHQAIKTGKWHDVPIFGADPPYWEDERSYEYYANELRRMVDFITEHTGYTMDIDRLREVCEESNKEYALWQEYNELRRVVPCPHDWTIGPPQCFAMATFYYPGKPGGVEWFKKLIANAEKRVKAGVSGVPGGERIRVLWFDILPLMWQFDIQPWLEAEWGVNMVMNMFGYTPYEPIDTTSEATMFRGLAKRSLAEYPMIRQARGVADNFLSDIERIVKDYSIDCVIWPGHMGHKDGSASIGMMREKCREIGVPFLHIGLDLFDKRYTGVDDVKDIFSRFFSAAGLGQK
jgi:benzoyl-CoA reductase/2-hydroxyglutaryl-CoA dehydratase subunit BcrC/BadD/HgdB